MYRASDQHERPAPRFERTIPASDLETRAVLCALTGWLAEQGVSDDVSATVELVLAEALNNVVEHAYGYGPGLIWLSMLLQGNALDCRIVDQGQPLLRGLPPAVLPDFTPLACLPEGGFGWYIIRSLTRNLQYRSQNGRNELIFQVALGSVSVAL